MSVPIDNADAVTKMIAAAIEKHIAENGGINAMNLAARVYETVFTLVERNMRGGYAPQYASQQEMQREMQVHQQHPADVVGQMRQTSSDGQPIGRQLGLGSLLGR